MTRTSDKETGSTTVLYDPQDILNSVVEMLSVVKYRIDTCADYNTPSSHITLKPITIDKVALDHNPAAILTSPLIFGRCQRLGLCNNRILTSHDVF